MRARIAFAIIVVLTLGAVVVVTGGDGGGAPSALREQEEEEGLGPAEPDDYFLFQRSSGGRLPRTSDFTRAVRQAQEIRSQTAASAARKAAAWSLEGPTNIGGRLADLAIHPTEPDTVYVAAATGGVWKTTDGGATLQQAWPDDASQSMGAIAIGPDGTIWAGTGELNPGGGSITFGGTGIYRSDDGGRKWKRRGLEDSGTTGRIVVDPTDPDTIYVAAGGSLFNAGGDRGIYRSTNGGASWRQVLAPETPFTGGADLVMDPTNPDRLYAAMWDHRREPDVRTYGGLGSGLFRTDDGGDTWRRLENVLTKTPGNENGPADESGLARDATLGRIGVAVAPSNPDRVYVITTHTFGQDKGFYVSNDGGESFNTATRPGSQGGFGWWFGRIWVDPANLDHLFVAGVRLRESFDGGQTWANSSGPHVDQHAMEWAATAPGRVYLGNDGGLYRSDANGATLTWRKATYEPYTQHYQVEVAETDPSRLTGGTQDNNCIRTWGGARWNAYGCGDGEYVPIDWSDPNIYYGCSQYGACRRYDDRTGTSSNIQDGTAGPRFNWYAPLVIDSNDPETIYLASNQLNRSTDRGDTWIAISPPHPNDLTGTFEPGRNDPVYWRWGTITTVGVSKTEPETLYVGTDTGRLWKTTDLGATWTEFTDAALPKRWVTRVAVDPRDEDVVYATFSGFRRGEDAAHVFNTRDGGDSWEDISGNLPNAPVNDVVVDTERSTVHVGSDVGVFSLKNGKKNWKAVGGELPLAPVLDLRLHAPSGSLFAGTFGRSVWKVGL
ncbi:MAG: WD40/YVTN/BNR-like repeat-containing protein [Solirubrobacteraceae bacterium]